MIVANDKPFSQEAFHEFDTPGKNAAASWLKQMGCQSITENDDSANNFQNIFDLEASRKNGEKLVFEVEVKKEWGTEWQENHDNPKYGWASREYPFPWPTMDFPYRKRESKRRAKVTHHIIVGGDYNRLFIVPRDVVLQSPVEDKYVRNRKTNEPFFKVGLPCAKGAWYELRDGKWEKVKRGKRQRTAQ
jgi:hypothetical protein